MKLGDLDALKEVIKANHYLLSAKNNSTDYGMFTTGIIQAIDNAPAVIVDNCGKCPYYAEDDRNIITEAFNDGYNTAREKFERPQGEWVEQKNYPYQKCRLQLGYECNQCGTECEYRVNFCPYCGADMRGKEE